MKFSSTASITEIEALRDKLLAAGHEADITHDEEFIYLNTTEAGDKWIRLQLETPTKVAPAPVFAKPNVQGEEAPSVSNDFKKVFLPAIAIVALLFWGISALAGSSQTGSISSTNAQYTAGQMSGNESIEELRARREKEYGRSSDWGVNFAVYMQKELLNNPRTGRTEDYRMFTFERDSLTVVYAFSGENAFGVRSDHSVTFVVDPHTGDIARVVSMQ